MITIFDIKFTSSEGLRKALNLWGSKWCAKVDIKDLLRMAFPELDDSAIKKNLIHFSENGIFKTKPVPPKAIHTNYCHEFGYSLPYDVNRYVYEEPKNEPKVAQKVTCIEPKVTKAKVKTMEIKPQQNDEMSQIKQMLLDEIALIQDAKNYTTQDGSIDTQKAELLFKRAEAVNNIAASLNDMRRTEIETKKLQLDAVRTALNHGYDVKVNGNILGVQIEHSR